LIVKKNMQIYFQVRHKTTLQNLRRLKVYETPWNVWQLCSISLKTITASLN